MGCNARITLITTILLILIIYNCQTSGFQMPKFRTRYVGHKPRKTSSTILYPQPLSGPWHPYPREKIYSTDNPRARQLPIIVGSNSVNPKYGPPEPTFKQPSFWGTGVNPFQKPISISPVKSDRYYS